MMTKKMGKDGVLVYFILPEYLIFEWKRNYNGVLGGRLKNDGSTAATFAVKNACMQNNKF